MFICCIYSYDEVMLPCWSSVASRRPTFDVIIKQMREFFGQHGDAGDYVYDAEQEQYVTKDQEMYTNTSFVNSVD